MVLDPIEVEERIVALEERNEKLLRLIRSGRAFTENPLALSTDLDDLGSVKTHIEFETAPLVPVTPASGLGRLYGVDEVDAGAAALRYIDDQGNFSEVTHPPCVRVFNDANLAITKNTDTALTFNTERFDTDAMHSTSSNSSRLTINTAGVYQMTGNIEWAQAGSAARAFINIRLNGSSFLAGTGDLFEAMTNMQTVTTLYEFAVGDYVELVVRQESTGTVNVLRSADFSPEFQACWMAPLVP